MRGAPMWGENPPRVESGEGSHARPTKAGQHGWRTRPFGAACHAHKAPRRGCFPTGPGARQHDNSPRPTPGLPRGPPGRGARRKKPWVRSKPLRPGFPVEQPRARGGAKRESATSKAPARPRGPPSRRPRESMPAVSGRTRFSGRPGTRGAGGIRRGSLTRRVGVRVNAGPSAGDISAGANGQVRDRAVRCRCSW